MCFVIDCYSTITTLRTTLSSPKQGWETLCWTKYWLIRGLCCWGDKGGIVQDLSKAGTLNETSSQDGQVPIVIDFLLANLHSTTCTRFQAGCLLNWTCTSDWISVLTNKQSSCVHCSLRFQCHVFHVCLTITIPTPTSRKARTPALYPTAGHLDSIVFH